LDEVNNVGTIHSFFAGYCFCVHVYIITDFAISVNQKVALQKYYFLGLQM
jgi:hypothetical protein